MTVDQQKPIETYAPQGSPEEVLLAYPGQRPEGSYLTDGTEIVQLSENFDEFFEQCDTLLAKQGLPGMDQRIPVVTYGANANPWNLEEKLQRASLRDAQENELSTVPVCVAELPDIAVVWHGRTSQKGSVFSELYAGPEAEGLQTTAHVAFLTVEQLGMVHVTEGSTYGVVELPVVAGSEKAKLKAFAYTALDASVLLKDGKPVLVDGVQSATTELPHMAAHEAVEYILHQPAVESRVGKKDPRTFVAEGIAMTLAERKARQAQVSAGLAEEGLRKAYYFESEHAQPTGRLALAAMLGNPGGIVLADEVFRRIRPTREEVAAEAASLAESDAVLKIKEGESREEAALRTARLRLDPMVRLRAGAHDELALRQHLDGQE